MAPVTRVGRWFAAHPIPWTVRAMEALVRTLNSLLAMFGALIVLWVVWSLWHLPEGMQSPSSPALTIIPHHGQSIATAASPSTLHAALTRPLGEEPATQTGGPWFLYAFGTAGAAAALTACTAIMGAWLRSPACLGANVSGCIPMLHCMCRS